MIDAIEKNIVSAATSNQAESQTPSTISKFSRPPIPALTGLRFFAAFFILVAHAGYSIGQFQDSNISRYISFIALYGMQLFFVLSGFVIEYNYKHLFLTKGI